MQKPQTLEETLYEALTKQFQELVGRLPIDLQTDHDGIVADIARKLAASFCDEQEHIGRVDEELLALVNRHGRN